MEGHVTGPAHSPASRSAGLSPAGPTRDVPVTQLRDSPGPSDQALVFLELQFLHLALTLRENYILMALVKADSRGTRP